MAFLCVQQPMYSTLMVNQAAAHNTGPANQTGSGSVMALLLPPVSLPGRAAGWSTGMAQAVPLPACSTALLQVLAYGSQRAEWQALQQVPDMQPPPCLQVLWLSQHSGVLL